MSEPGILPEPIPFGKYYLLERINVGGMAEVYKAKAFGVEGFERLLAIKQILESIARDESFINMFIDEAKIAGQLTHPNIAQIFDLGQVDGSYFIALEYISGKDLKTIFERSRRIGEKVSIPRICYIIMKVCEGLGYAHEKKDPQGNDLNIVHRDISPQNVLLSYEGEVKIIDFGIAKAQGKTSQTQAGMLKGKFSYMSPEQVRGIHVDHRSDIFSLGIVLYELLTLERLFLGESDFEIMRKIRHVEMSPPSLYNPHVPKELEDIVLKALAGNSGERYQSTFELAEDLERFMRSQGYYYTNKDLAAYMKEAFQADIEFENKKLDYYRTLNLQPIEPSAGGQAPVEADLSWDDEEMETQIFDRASPQPYIEPVSESDIVYADDLDIIEITDDDEVTQIHVPGIPPPSDEDPTVEFDRWEADLNLSGPASSPALDLDLDIQPRRAPRPTEEMPAVERRGVPQVTVPNATLYQDPSRNRSGDKARMGVIALVAILVVIGGLAFAFLSRNTAADVTFVFGDGPVQIAINDELIHDGPTPVDLAIEAGQAKVRVTREGYEPYETTTTFTAGENARLEAELRPFDYARTGFDLKTTPEGAKIFVDGEDSKDTSPASLRELKPGTYKVRVELEDYLTKEDEIEVTHNEVGKLNWTLLPAKVNLAINSEPSRSNFKVYTAEDKKEVASGRTPGVAQGLDATKTYRVVVERSRYETWEETFEPGADREAALNAALDRADQPVEQALASTGTGAAASRDSSSSPGPSAPARPRPEPKPEPRPQPQPEQKPSQPARAAEKPSGSGTISVASRPAARVYINDRDTGRYTPLMDFELPAGTHKIVLINEDFNLNKTYYVDLKPGGSERVINR